MTRVFHRPAKYGDYLVLGKYGTIYQTYGGWFVDLVTNIYLGAILCDNTISQIANVVAGLNYGIQADNSPSGIAYLD